MKKKYIKPTITVVPIAKDWQEGIMTTLSIGQGTGPAGTTGNSKPNNQWGDIWAEPMPPATTDDFHQQPVSNPDGTWQ